MSDTPTRRGVLKTLAKGGVVGAVGASAVGTAASEQSVQIKFLSCPELQVTGPRSLTDSKYTLYASIRHGSSHLAMETVSVSPVTFPRMTFNSETDTTEDKYNKSFIRWAEVTKETGEGYETSVAVESNDSDTCLQQYGWA